MFNKYKKHLKTYNINIKYFYMKIKKNMLIKIHYILNVTNSIKTKINAKKKITFFTLKTKIKKTKTYNFIKIKNNVKNFFYDMYLYCNNKNIILSTFIRKNKIYIKSKFSRARLYTKNIVFFGLIINIIFISELNMLYYNITINYGYYIQIVYFFLTILSIKIIIRQKLYINFLNNLNNYITKYIIY